MLNAAGSSVYDDICLLECSSKHVIINLFIRFGRRLRQELILWRRKHYLFRLQRCCFLLVITHCVAALLLFLEKVSDSLLRFLLAVSVNL